MEKIFFIGNWNDFLNKLKKYLGFLHDVNDTIHLNIHVLVLEHARIFVDATLLISSSNIGTVLNLQKLQLRNNLRKRSFVREKW